MAENRINLDDLPKRPRIYELWLIHYSRSLKLYQSPKPQQNANPPYMYKIQEKCHNNKIKEPSHRKSKAKLNAT